MAKSLKKLRAVSLRKKGTSVGDIARMLGVSKSTASIWCQGIALTDKQKDRLVQKVIKAGHVGRLLGAQSNKDKKIENIRQSQVWAPEFAR
jgi:DNA-binding transcriptional regulator YiaG